MLELLGDNEEASKIRYQLQSASLRSDMEAFKVFIIFIIGC